MEIEFETPYTEVPRVSCPFRQVGKNKRVSVLAKMYILAACVDHQSESHMRRQTRAKEECKHTHTHKKQHRKRIEGHMPY